MFKRSSFLKSSKLVRKRRKLLLIKGAVLFVFVIGIVVGLSYLSKAPFLSLKEIKVEGNSIVETGEIMKVIEERLNGNYGGIFSRRNTFLYPREAIETELAQRFPRFESVEVAVDDLNYMIINVTERSSHALWCRNFGEIGTDGDDQCFFLDKKSFIFAPAPYFSGNAFVKYYGLKTDESPIGQYYFGEERFGEVDQFITELNTFGLKVETFVASTTKEYEVMLKKDGKYADRFARVLLNDTAPLSRAAENLKLFLRENGYEKRGQDLINRIQYVDLRFGNKIYYKIEGKTPASNSN